MRRRLFCGVLIGGWLSGVWLSQAWGQSADIAYEPRVVLQRPLPAITDAPIVKAAGARVALNELVVGVEVNGESRAYPINQLTGPRREIINDRLGGTAIAATW